MEVGQVNKLTIGAIIQARYASIRLPGKVILPLPIANGKPVLEHITETLKRNTIIDNIVIATSDNSENDVIRGLAQKLRVNCLSGSENDVLSRFLSIITKGNINICIRLTGDNPLVDNNKLTEAINYLIDEDVDYLYTTGLPLGMNFEIFKAESLLKCGEYNLTDKDKEHVTLFLRESGKFKTRILDFKTDKIILNLRCTIDYPNDFAFMNLLFSIIDYSSNDLISEISKAYKKYPWITEINSDNFQKMQGLSIQDEINRAIGILSKYELNKAIGVLENYR
jgi:spore coat polysaccharide biosynthesis protein SpsF (cytidylyltransferase family)